MTQSETDARVVVSKDGPYLVTGGIPITRQTIVSDSSGGSEEWVEGAPVTASASYELCRCGRSNTKPFCDDTHNEVGFDGTETASREPYHSQAGEIDGPTMKLLDAEPLCAYARFCEPNDSVWDLVEHSDDPEAREKFIRQVGNCPSGRLVAWDKETDSALEPTLPVSIGLVEHPVEESSGPLWLRGGILVVSDDGFEYEVRNRVTLCRCGESKNKPFCDGAHATVKFRDASAPKSST